jgi:hypothetical protein
MFVLNFLQSSPKSSHHVDANWLVYVTLSSSSCSPKSPKRGAKKKKKKNQPKKKRQWCSTDDDSGMRLQTNLFEYMLDLRMRTIPIQTLGRLLYDPTKTNEMTDDTVTNKQQDKR